MDYHECSECPVISLTKGVKQALIFTLVLSIKMQIPKSVFRSNRPEVFCKKGVLINFAKFTGKHLRQSLFFNKTFSKFLRKPTLNDFPSCDKFVRTPDPDMVFNLDHESTTIKDM